MMQPFRALNGQGELHQVTSDTAYAYLWRQGAQQSRVTFDADTSTTANAVTETTFNYDLSGRLRSAAVGGGQARTMAYVTDAEGRVLSRAEDYTGATADTKTVSLFFDGVQVGEVTNAGASSNDYATALARRTAAEPRRSIYPGQTRPSWAERAPRASADFDQAYAPLTPESGAAVASSWTVREGETLGSIAQAAWGDASPPASAAATTPTGRSATSSRPPLPGGGGNPVRRGRGGCRGPRCARRSASRPSRP